MKLIRKQYIVGDTHDRLIKKDAFKLKGREKGNQSLIVRNILNKYYEKA